ncbi:nectin-1-like [Sardina pilchardus]|uniref:nectin-1-like n=1 Tax=Sardina pilchardus TaxID=27697 RepID=UPI002E0D7A08
MRLSTCWSVTYTHQEICAVESSSVDIRCYYSYPSSYVVRKPLWKYNVGSGPLKVEKNQGYLRETLTCISTCPADSRPTYIWYRNRQPVGDKYTTRGNTLMINYPVSSADSGPYSCALKGHEDRPSPPVCVSSCSSVTYTHQKICAVEGSSVNITCSYSYPSGYVVRKPLWKFNLGSGEETMDFSVKNTHDNDVEYIGNKDTDCSLSLRYVKHTGKYYFKFSTNEDDEEFSGKPEVSLSVTGLLVNMSSDTVEEGKSVRLTCSTTCTLNEPPSYIWYKNSQPIADRQAPIKILRLNPVRLDDSGLYSCAVRGHEDRPSPVRALSVSYSPKNTRVIGSSSGEGSSMTLTCKADANPPVHTYSWYRKTSSGSVLMDTGNSSSYTGVSDGEIYYCVAHNEYGFHNSSEIEVSFTALLQQTGVPGGVFAALGIILVVAVIVVLVFVRRRGKGLSTTENTSAMVEHRQGEEPSPVYEDASAVLLTSNQEDRVDSGRDRVDSGGDGVVSGGDGVVSGGDGVVSADHVNSGGDSVVSGGDQVDAGGDEDDVQYASVQFKPKNKDAAPDSPAVQLQEKKVEEEESAYASVKFRSPSRDVNQDEDDTAIYSIVNKPRS